MRSDADYEHYRWLLSDAAGRLLAELAAAGDELLAIASRLRQDLCRDRVHLLLSQLELRRRAKAKFSRPERMFFTTLGLEQSTDEWVAAYKAGRMICGGNTVCDLCCGIGGDLLGLSQIGAAVGLDRNPVSTLFAKANCDAAGGHPAAVIVADATQLPLALGAWHIDPDRRPGGHRSTRVALHSPGLPAIESLLRACPNGAIKLAPAARFPEHWEQEAECEWISRGGECKQLVAWFGSLSYSPGRRRATIVLDRARLPTTRTIVGDADRPLNVADGFARYLAEPDSAVLAAGLLGTLAAERGLAAIAPGAVYLTGDRPDADPALAWFEIVETLPFDSKRLKAHLRHRGIGRLEIKQRGVGIDPDKLRQELSVPGSEQRTLFLARRGKRIMAVLAQRVQPNQSP